MKVFLDTSAFVAINFSKDAWHAQALVKQDLLRRQRAILITSNAVLYETLTWFAVKLGPRSAEAFGQGIWTHSPDLRILALSREDELGSLAVLRKYGDVRLSFVDASILYLVMKLGMDRVFSFDRHFEQAGVVLF